MIPAPVTSQPPAESRVKFLAATFRNILWVVLLIFVFAVVQMFTLWAVCNTGMKAANSLEHQGLPTLNDLASLQEHLAIYRLNSYEYLFAKETDRAAKALAVDTTASQTRAELKAIQGLLPEGEGRQLAANLETAMDDLDKEFRKVRSLVDADFPAAMQAMDQDIPPRIERVASAAQALKNFGYAFSGGQANASFASFGWIKQNAILFASGNILVAFCAFLFVRIAAQRSRAQLSETLARLDERTNELSYERDLLRSLLNYSSDPIYFKDAQSRFLMASKVQAGYFGLADAEALVGKSDFDFFTEEHARPAYNDEQEIIRTGKPLIGKMERETYKDGRTAWVLTSKMPLRNPAGQIIGTFGISKDITGIKQAEAKLAEMHQELVETSRQAGMAEIATNVLHNVGNVLNSVNVSATMITDSIKKSKTANLAKVVGLLREHQHDLGTFITTDAKGKQLPGYLAQLSDHLQTDQTATVKELDFLLKNIDHIKEIVAMQQSYAKVSGVREIVNVQDLVEDSLRMNEGALNRHNVDLAREYTALPPINVEKHKVVQILVNLIRNAKYACDDSGRTDKCLTVRLTGENGRIKISIIDNGIGIPPENLNRVFNHGFTTRKNGHGFGLHSGANAAKEMGGSLTAHSEGLGHGAMFILELPAESGLRNA
jgi:PAS domain S-box-containing protein